MFNSNLLQILGPIPIKSEFLLPDRIKPLHDTLDTILEPHLELRIVLIPRLDDHFVVLGIG